MPCETAKRDLNRFGRERTSRSNVAPSQGAKLPRGGWRRTTFLPAFAPVPLAETPVTEPVALIVSRPADRGDPGRGRC